MKIKNGNKMLKHHAFTKGHFYNLAKLYMYVYIVLECCTKFRNVFHNNISIPF